MHFAPRGSPRGRDSFPRWRQDSPEALIRLLRRSSRGAPQAGPANAGWRGGHARVPLCSRGAGTHHGPRTRSGVPPRHTPPLPLPCPPDGAPISAGASHLPRSRAVPPSRPCRWSARRGCGWRRGPARPRSLPGPATCHDHGRCLHRGRAGGLHAAAACGVGERPARRLIPVRGQPPATIAGGASIAAVPVVCTLWLRVAPGASTPVDPCRRRPSVPDVAPAGVGIGVPARGLGAAPTETAPDLGRPDAVPRLTEPLRALLQQGHALDLTPVGGRQAAEVDT